MIDLGNDVEGYLRASEIAADRVEDATTVLKKARKSKPLLSASIARTAASSSPSRRRDAAEARDALDRLNASDVGSATGTTNLGALLKAKLEQK